MQVFDKEIIKEKCKWLIMWEKCVFMLWEQGVAGSNPATPTQKTKELQKCDSFFVFPTYLKYLHGFLDAVRKKTASPRCTIV